MTERVIGPTGSPRRRWTLLLPLVVMIALGLFYIAGAQAVHDTGAFELDGNAVAATSDDWDEVCKQVTITDDPAPPNAIADQCGTAGALGADVTAVAWQDDGALNSTIFTGGGSKDPQDINQWAWKDEAGGLPDKDNLLHAFAARYSLTGTNATGSCPNGTNPFNAAVRCEVIYFGSDRFDNSGDAHQAFWFLQDEIGLNGPKVGGGTGFTGVHQNNDLLVISNFSNGGTTSTIVVYKWDSTCASGVTKPGPGDCGDQNLRLLQSSEDALCGEDLPANDAFCGIVNSSNGTPAPWTYTDKSGNSTYLQGEFYEAGVNLSTLGLAGACFSSVVSETRSSTSTTATLKDFVLESFDVCAPELTTVASTNSTTVPVGTPVTDTAIVQIVGATSPPDPLGTVTFYLCQVDTGGCTSTSNQVGLPVALNNTDCNPDSPNNTDGKRCAVSAQVNTQASPLLPGKRYCFRATADLTNYDDPAAHTDATDECFQLASVPTTISTRQFVFPQDRATVTASAGGNLVGTLTFRLFGAAGGNTALQNCQADVTSGGTSTAGLIHSESVSIASSASPQTRRTNNTADAVVVGGTYYWHVMYDSTNAAQDDSASACAESTVYTFNGDDANITVPGAANP